MKSSYSTTNLNIDPEQGKWGFDSVTNKELGWWLAKDTNDKRSRYVESVIKHLKLPKVTDKQKALEVIKSDNTRMYLTLSEELRDDPEILEIQAKTHKGNCMCEASERLQNNVEMAKIIIKYDTTNIHYLTDEMKNNPEVMMVIAKNKGGSQMIMEAGSDILSNKSIALVSVSNIPYTLTHFNNTIRDDSEVVLVAISKDRDSLVYASPRYQNFRMKYLPIWMIKTIGVDNLV